MQIDENNKINIYAGLGQLPELSNLSQCHFTFLGKKFTSVEQAYMYFKAMMFGDLYIANKILDTDSTREAKRLGKKVKNFNKQYWEYKAYSIMKSLIRASIQQNYYKRNALMNTGNALLTHHPETSRWLEDFPKILMELRHEFKQ